MEQIVVHPLTADPSLAWEQIKQQPGRGTVMRFKYKDPTEAAGPDKVRLVCLSDTHSLTSHMKRPPPDGDVLIHAGDFTRCGHVAEVREFNEWLGSLPHPHKIVIAGNHELSFQWDWKRPPDAPINLTSPSPKAARAGDAFAMATRPCNSVLSIQAMGQDAESLRAAAKSSTASQTYDVKATLTNCIYLQDSSVTLYGLKFYGTPWQPEYSGLAFNLRRGQALLNKWELIPDDTDVLITHTPPVGFGDLCCTGQRTGCVELLNSVQMRIRPKYHIYGHIHEGYGLRSDGRTVFVNASVCNLNYMPRNKPIVVDISLPAGVTKHHFT